MEELTKRGEEMEWKETARWIKFEENVEECNEWGKPHVASLTFHSLLELRKGLEKGTRWRNAISPLLWPLSFDLTCTSLFFFSSLQQMTLLINAG